MLLRIDKTVLRCFLNKYKGFQFHYVAVRQWPVGASFMFERAL